MWKEVQAGTIEWQTQATLKQRGSNSKSWHWCQTARYMCILYFFHNLETSCGIIARLTKNTVLDKGDWSRVTVLRMLCTLMVGTWLWGIIKHGGKTHYNRIAIYGSDNYRRGQWKSGVNVSWVTTRSNTKSHSIIVDPSRRLRGSASISSPALLWQASQRPF